jgi:hypothetical protein
MFFFKENQNKKNQQKTRDFEKNSRIANNNSKSKKQNIKREKIVKINNPKNVEHQINNVYQIYQKNNNTTMKHFFVRIHFNSQNNSYLALQNNIWDFLNFIHNKIEKSFVLESNNIQTFYSSCDNQVRVKIYYDDLNIKRIFVNTASNLFSNLNFFLNTTANFNNIMENFLIESIKVTEENEKNILGIFENDVFIIPDITPDDNINENDNIEEYLEEDIDICSDYNDIHDKPQTKYENIYQGYDFIIIGGSPGGIMTAYKLATEYLDKKILIIESGEKTLENYKKVNYNNTSKWWEASNDDNYKTTLTDIDDKVISQGKGLGGGSLHFGLQYIDHYDLINLDYKDWLQEFDELSNILKPQTYNYSINDNNITPSKAHFELLSELSKSKEMITYNNKVYCNNLKTNSRILYGDLVKDLKNVCVKYNCKISKINFTDNRATSCESDKGDLFKGQYIILSAGAIQTPIILQNSNIECGNQIYDHCGITLLYDKYDIETKIELKDSVEGYSEEELKKTNLTLLSITNIKELNTKNKMIAIINHTKLSDSEITKASNGSLPSYNIRLDDANSIKYVYDMGTYWLPRNGHPGGSLSNYLIENEYDLTSTLLSRHGQAYNRLFLGKPAAKLIGVLTIKESITKEIEVPVNDIGFNNSKIIPHLQTHDIKHKWQTYYSYLPNLENKLIVTHAQCKNLPKTGYVKIDKNKPKVHLDHLGNTKQRDLTLNYIYDAYIKNNEYLEKLGYTYKGTPITKKYIEKSINSLYHYHGTCAIGDVVNKRHKVINTNNLFIADCSILPKPWPGSTSVPAAVAGIVTANKIKNEINNPIFEWVNSNEYINSGKTYDVVLRALNRWNSVITGIPTNKPIQFTFALSDDLEPGVLGAAQLTKYIIKDTLEIKDLNEETYFNDLQNRNIGEVFPYSGEIILNRTTWNSKLDDIDEFNNPRVYYILLHEIGHLLGIGPLWILYGILLYDESSEAFFYGGANGNREYKNLFPDLNLSYMPLENDGGPGTAVVHPEEGPEEGASENNRYFNGVFHPGLDTELMTGWSEKSKDPQKLPLSRITIAMCDDIGYDVDYDAADPFKIDYKK